MKTCDRVAGKLASGEPLDGQEEKHLTECQACFRLRAVERSISQTARQMGSLADADSRCVQALIDQVEKKLERPVGRSRMSWAWAGLAAVGVAVALAVWWPGLDLATEERAAEDLFSLMDEVAAVVDPDLAMAELEEDASSSDVDDGAWELPLPAGYEPVENLIEDRWL